ncbi:HAMP domain-containing histidine kinase [Halorussus salilacus]|uniref:sensor histidine kinase n=1 Tax=Halorussus salilacus TaxID=2953750 RepID=UPI00209EFE7E|nr:HAMP domain-containing sensor histidine kinase [Halorussus salilacus]USZ67422.1 HAMP domain-containing histidine kinase [Halorussus salilacus]
MSADSRRHLICRSDHLPSILSAIGVLFLASALGEWLLFNGTGEFDSVDFFASTSVSAFLTAAIVYGGFRLGRSDISNERYPRIVGWIAGCSSAFLAVNLPIMLAWIPATVPAQLWWARFVVSVGLVGGLFIGSIEARAIERERVAERAAVRAEEAETHHRHLDYLNSLLRHEVLNTANVITGYASLLLENDEVAAEARDRVETIHRRGEDMTSVIRDVRVLLTTTSGTAALEPTDLSSVLEAELDDLRRTADAVEIEASIPDGVVVVADDLLARAFSNLLTNAVEHHDGGVPRVTVTVEESAETATVYVADDGPGIPPGERATLFERSDNTGGSHGLGLYLVRTLVERYGGTVELVETGDDGTEFALTLPKATRTTDDRPRRVGAQTL